MSGGEEKERAGSGRGRAVKGVIGCREREEKGRVVQGVSEWREEGEAEERKARRESGRAGDTREG